MLKFWLNYVDKTIHQERPLNGSTETIFIEVPRYFNVIVLRK